MPAPAPPKQEPDNQTTRESKASHDSAPQLAEPTLSLERQPSQHRANFDRFALKICTFMDIIWVFGKTLIVSIIAIFPTSPILISIIKPTKTHNNMTHNCNNKTTHNFQLLGA
jgi:hypothetical protein